jgi:hypothetical protein
MKMRIQVDNASLELAIDGKQTFEILLGETAALAPAAAIASQVALTIAQTSGAAATISGASITPSAAGLSKYTVSLADGSAFELRLFCCETATVTTIAGQARTTGYGTSSAPRLVLRSLVNDRPAWFTGTNASLAGHSLAAYGA